MYDENTHRVALTSQTDDGKPEFLQIETRHQAGGHSFLSGEHSERGVYVSFTVCYGDLNNTNVTGFTLFDKRGGKLLAQPTARKTPKKIAATAALVAENLDQIVTAWKARDWAEVNKLIGKESANA